jgi:hypothetical protein
MRRHLFGILALVCLLGGVAFWLVPEQVGYEAYHAECWRLGSVMLMIWLAYPNLSRLPPWLAVAVPLGLIVLIYRRNWLRALLPWLWALIPALIILTMLRPRNAAKTRR